MTTLINDLRRWTGPTASSRCASPAAWAWRCWWSGSRARGAAGDELSGRGRTSWSRARLLHSRARKVRHNGDVQDAQETPSDLHARVQGAALLLDGSRGAPAGGARPHTMAEYVALFADAEPEQRVGEASPQYIRSPSAASLIAQAQPEARIIAILREPASFLHALHIQCVQSRLEPERDLRKALALEQPRREGRFLPPGTHAVLAHVLPARALCRAAASLPRALPPGSDAGADLRRLPPRQRGRRSAAVMRFLEVDASVVLEPFQAHARTAQSRQVSWLCTASRDGYAWRATIRPRPIPSRGLWRDYVPRSAPDALAPARLPGSAAAG